MERYRHSLFLSIMVLILFHQLIYKKFYASAYMNDVNKENKSTAKDFVNAYELFLKLGERNGYVSEEEWVLGMNNEEEVNSFFWNKVDSILYLAIDESFQQFKKYYNTLVCPNDSIIHIAESDRHMPDRVIAYQFEGVEVYCHRSEDYKESLKTTVPIVRYTIYFYPKNLEGTKYVWTSTPRRVTTSTKEFTVLENPKELYWQTLKMEHPIFSAHVPINVKPFKLEKKRIKIWIFGRGFSSFGENPCDSPTDVFDLNPLRQRPDTIIKYNSNAACFRIDENGIDTIFGVCKKYKYDYK